MTRLMVLGLLAWRPMHGYEIHQYLQVSRTDLWANVLAGSIYHALKKMEEEGLVTVQATEQTGHRTRAIYARTPAGEAEFRRLLKEAWSTPPRIPPSSVYVALGFLDGLPRDEVLAALDAQIAALEAQAAEWDAGAEAKEKVISVPEYVKAAFENRREHFQADLRFLRRLRRILPLAKAPQPPPAEEET